MDLSIFLARFWGSLFMLLGLQSIGTRFLGRVIKMTDDKTVTVSTGYITFLLGLATVVAHNLWVNDWRAAVTILGWVTLLKGMTKIGFPEHVHKQAQMFKSQQYIWAMVIFFLGAWLFWVSL